MTSSIRPFITIIMPCYNGMMYLERSLEAFFSQKYINKKLVIVDGKSTDKSHEIISSYIAMGYPLVWDKTPDVGISSAINIGVNHLNIGDVFGYLGSDDILMPDVLDNVAYLFEMAECVDGFYFDSYSCFGENGGVIYRGCPTNIFSLTNLLKFGTIVGLQNIYIKGDLVKANGFSEVNKYSMDYELYIRLFKDKDLNFTHVPMPSSINMMVGNFSTKFVFEGAFEAINAAVKQVGYTPRLIFRLALLWLTRFKHVFFNQV
jgi:glycosyltransferase involved in cell wall biosynthesis